MKRVRAYSKVKSVCPTFACVHPRIALALRRSELRLAERYVVAGPTDSRSCASRLPHIYDTRRVYYSILRYSIDDKLAGVEGMVVVAQSHVKYNM